MDASYFRHKSDSQFCFSFDTHHALIRLAVSKAIIPDEVNVVYGDPMTFQHKHQSLRMIKKHEDAGFYYYEIIIEAYPMRLNYVFSVIYHGEKYFFCETGLHHVYHFDLAFISAFQYVGENYNDFVLEKENWKGRVIYQIFVERFNSRTNPKDKSYVNMDWNSPNIRNRRDAFLGGDIYGIVDKLDYLKWLGVGALYLTPIHPSNSNHKYNVDDYFDVDKTFGGKAAFKELMSKAHSNDMKVMMDLVFNHMGYTHPIFQDVLHKGKESKYYHWFFIDGDYPTASPLNYRCFGYHSYMPKLNTNNKEVQDYLISIGQYWINEFDVDGYRLDVSEGVSHDFWNRFKLAMKDIKRDILVIGENWHNSDSYLGNNELDSVMNYPFLGAVSSYVLYKTNAEELSYELDGLLMRHKDGHNRMMMNILASHDIQRAMNLVYNSKDLSLLAYAIMMFYLGYPLIYYGEEVFMEGGNDPDNRRGMHWDEKNYRDPKVITFRNLIQLRKEDALKTGDIEIGYKNNLFYIRRISSNIIYTLYTNTTNKAVLIEGNIILSNKMNGYMLEKDGFAITKGYK